MYHRHVGTRALLMCFVTNHPSHSDALYVRINFPVFPAFHTRGLEDSICHTPNPGPTRLADPNRVRDARPDTGTLYLIFFKPNWYLWVWPTSYNRVKISYTFTESHLLIHIQKPLYIPITYSERRTYCDEPLLVC